MKENKYDVLKLENQMCFPLYACSKEIIRRYKPYLDPLGLTYTQYITMMVLWEHKEINSKEMGKLLLLDSGTLTPVLKKLEKQGYLIRKRDKEDARNLLVSITQKGLDLQDKALEIPSKIGTCLANKSQNLRQLNTLLHELLSALRSEEIE